MTAVRTDIVQRQQKTITPKLHLLEAHTVSCMSRFGVALGARGEQGGESIHHNFNKLHASLSNNKGVDLLRVLVAQYLISTLPAYNKKIIAPQKQTRKA